MKKQLKDVEIARRELQTMLDSGMRSVMTKDRSKVYGHRIEQVPLTESEKQSYRQKLAMMDTAIVDLRKEIAE